MGLGETHFLIIFCSRFKFNDNAVAESFFHTLETELIHHEIYHTKEQAKRSIFEYIEVFYNRERSHSANNNLSPVEFEERQKLLQKEIAA